MPCVVWFVLVQTVLNLWPEIKLSLLSASSREKLFSFYTCPTVVIFCVCIFMVCCFWMQVKSALCDDCTTFSFFLYSALFSVQVYSRIFRKEIVNLVLHMFIPQTVLEGTLRAWVSPLAYSLAWSYDTESLLAYCS